MRILYFSFLCLGLTLIVCCNDEGPEEWPAFFTPYYGHAHLQLDNNTFECFPYATTSRWNDTTVTLNLLHYNEYNILRGQLSISNIPTILGVHAIIVGTGATSDGPGALYSAILSDGDVGGDLFAFDTTLRYSYVELTEWDTLTKQIQGAFDIQLLRHGFYLSNPELPDTLNVEGSFLTRVDFEE